MTDRGVLALAVAATAGALSPSPVPLVAALAATALALLVRRPVLLAVAVALLTSGGAQRALAGLEGAPVGDVAATITLVGDPGPSFGGVRAEARLGSRRVEVRASGPAAEALRGALAGEQVVVRGAVGPITAPRPWHQARHLAGRLQVFAVEGISGGSAPSRAANSLRRTLMSGARALPAEGRALYAGLVIGDDRDQTAEVADDFEGAGLTHLLAVSGQNVAFVLALARPLLQRLRLWPRALAGFALLGLFGLVTRFEPSVLRASAMAAVALLATTLGSPADRRRVLALAVTGILVVDPLLVHAVGFRLSVAASAAIVALTPIVEEALPGPRWLVEPLAVTTAAQLGVAPILLAAFGPLPVASLPANLLAVPAAGLVMAWGLTAGLVAGAVGGVGAEILHLPTRLLLAWLSEVASRGAALPLGHLGGLQLVLVASGLALAAGARARRPAPGLGEGAEAPRGVHGPVARAGPWVAVRRGGLVLAAAVVALAVAGAHRPVPLRQPLAPGLVRWHAGGTDVLALGGAGGRSQIGAGPALAALREAGVGAIDLVIVADPSVSLSTVRTIGRRHPLGPVVLGPGVDAGPLGEVGAAVVDGPVRPETIPVGALDVSITPTANRLVVEARRRLG